MAIKYDLSQAVKNALIVFGVTTLGQLLANPQYPPSSSLIYSSCLSGLLAGLLSYQKEETTESGQTAKTTSMLKFGV